MENLNMLTLGAAGAGGSSMFMILIVVMFVGMYFLTIRPQKKQQQKRQEMLKAMNKGDKVVTLGGIKGVIASIDRDNKEVVVDCDGIYLTFDLNFIRRSTPADSAKKPAEKADDKATTEKVEAPAEKTETETKTTDAAETSEAPKTDDADTKEETK